jgi:hypothetical protein
MKPWLKKIPTDTWGLCKRQMEHTTIKQNISEELHRRLNDI